MDFYLIEPGGPTLRLPVLPSEVTIHREKAYETVDIINLGEIDVPAGERIKEITFESFFAAAYDPSYCRYQDIPDPQAAMNQLTAWMMKKGPVRLIITDTIINTLVTVATHESRFVGGEPGDVYYSLILRTWREVKVRTAAQAAPMTTTAKAPRPDTKPAPKTYTVKPGDSLWKICKHHYGYADKATIDRVYEQNKATIGPDKNLIKPGQVLVMPS